MPADGRARAILFDLDGVITDTADLHYRSWQRLADELGLPFDRAINEHLRGLSRPKSLRIVLADRWEDFAESERAALLERKNRYYLDSVAAMSPADAFGGIPELLGDLRAADVRLAVASSSRNARVVLERLQLLARFDAIADGNDVEHSKPDPAVFLCAARRVEVPPSRCLVIEDAASGIEAARAARMKVVGVGPPERVARADARVERAEDLRADTLLRLLAKARQAE